MYCTSLIKSGYSPAELLMSIPLRNTVPNLPATIEPKWPFLQDFRVNEKQIKLHKTLNFGAHQNVHNLRF